MAIRMSRLGAQGEVEELELEETLLVELGEQGLLSASDLCVQATLAQRAALEAALERGRKRQWVFLASAVLFAALATGVARLSLVTAILSVTAFGLLDALVFTLSELRKLPLSVLPRGVEGVARFQLRQFTARLSPRLIQAAGICAVAAVAMGTRTQEALTASVAGLSLVAIARRLRLLPQS